MEPVILADIPARLSLEELQRRLHIGADTPQAAELRDLVREAEKIGRPRALCGVAYVDERGEDYVVVDGVRFSSRVLAVNLKDSHRVFPYLATCGDELEEWARSLGDMLHRYWSEAIREAAMRRAMAATAAYVEATFNPGPTSRMSPGSLSDWPIEEQLPLFRLLGDTERAVGVRLTPSLLMIPSKTVSGIRFGGAATFESCLLCPRSVCPNRRAPYDPGLYNAHYRKSPA